MFPVIAVHETVVPSQCLDARSELEGGLDGLVDVRETSKIMTQMEFIITRLSEHVYISSGWHLDSDIDSCKTCGGKPAFAGTDPDCFGCYNEHTGCCVCCMHMSEQFGEVHFANCISDLFAVSVAAMLT